MSSAEDLLSEIVKSTAISPTEKTQIETWLCMKAETDECIGTDLGPLRFNSTANRVLEVIEELSEPEVTLGSTSDEQQSDSEDSSMSSLGDEFYDQLAVSRDCFRKLTDCAVDKVQESNDTYSKIRQSAERRKTEVLVECKNECNSVSRKSSDRHSRKVSDSIVSRRGLQMAPRKTRDSVSSNSLGRNTSLASRLSPVIQGENLKKQEDVLDDASHLIRLSVSISDSNRENEIRDTSRDSSPSNVSRLSHDSDLSREKSEVDQNGEDSSGGNLAAEVKRLSISQDSKRGTIRKVSGDLRAAQQRLKQLNATIRMKEAFIRELMRSEGEAEVTKKKCEMKMERLEKEVQRARLLYQEAQSQLDVS